jgi:hypothetical protein
MVSAAKTAAAVDVHGHHAIAAAHGGAKVNRDCLSVEGCPGRAYVGRQPVCCGESIASLVPGRSTLLRLVAGG